MSGLALRAALVLVLSCACAAVDRRDPAGEFAGSLVQADPALWTGSVVATARGYHSGVGVYIPTTGGVTGVSFWAQIPSNQRYLHEAKYVVDMRPDQNAYMNTHTGAATLGPGFRLFVNGKPAQEVLLDQWAHYYLRADRPVETGIHLLERYNHQEFLSARVGNIIVWRERARGQRLSPAVVMGTTPSTLPHDRAVLVNVASHKRAGQADFEHAHDRLATTSPESAKDAEVLWFDCEGCLEYTDAHPTATTFIVANIFLPNAVADWGAERQQLLIRAFASLAKVVPELVSVDPRSSETGGPVHSLTIRIVVDKTFAHGTQSSLRRVLTSGGIVEKLNTMGIKEPFVDWLSGPDVVTIKTPFSLEDNNALETPTVLELAPGKTHPPLMRGIIDVHGCDVGLGFTWCETLGQCVQDWENGEGGPCPVCFNGMLWCEAWGRCVDRNHACHTPMQAEHNPPVRLGQRDPVGCLGSVAGGPGFTFCEVKNMCIQNWVGGKGYPCVPEKSVRPEDCDASAGMRWCEAVQNCTSLLDEQSCPDLKPGEHKIQVGFSLVPIQGRTIADRCVTITLATMLGVPVESLESTLKTVEGTTRAEVVIRGSSDEFLVSARNSLTVFAATNGFADKMGSCGVRSVAMDESAAQQRAQDKSQVAVLVEMDFRVAPTQFVVQGTFEFDHVREAQEHLQDVQHVLSVGSQVPAKRVSVAVAQQERFVDGNAMTVTVVSYTVAPEAGSEVVARDCARSLGSLIGSRSLFDALRLTVFAPEATNPRAGTLPSVAQHVPDGAVSLTRDESLTVATALAALAQVAPAKAHVEFSVLRTNHVNNTHSVLVRARVDASTFTEAESIRGLLCDALGAPGALSDVPPKIATFSVTNIALASPPVVAELVSIVVGGQEFHRVSAVHTTLRLAGMGASAIGKDQEKALQSAITDVVGLPVEIESIEPAGSDDAPAVLVDIKMPPPLSSLNSAARSAEVLLELDEQSDAGAPDAEAQDADEEAHPQVEDSGDAALAALAKELEASAGAILSRQEFQDTQLTVGVEKPPEVAEEVKLADSSPVAQPEEDDEGGAPDTQPAESLPEPVSVKAGTMVQMIAFDLIVTNLETNSLGARGHEALAQALATLQHTSTADFYVFGERPIEPAENGGQRVLFLSLRRLVRPGVLPQTVMDQVESVDWSRVMPSLRTSPAFAGWSGQVLKKGKTLFVNGPWLSVEAPPSPTPSPSAPPSTPSGSPSRTPTPTTSPSPSLTPLATPSASPTPHSVLVGGSIVLAMDIENVDAITFHRKLGSKLKETLRDFVRGKTLERLGVSEVPDRRMIEAPVILASVKGRKEFGQMVEVPADWEGGVETDRPFTNVVLMIPVISDSLLDANQLGVELVQAFKDGVFDELVQKQIPVQDERLTPTCRLATPPRWDPFSDTKLRAEVRATLELSGHQGIGVRPSNRLGKLIATGFANELHVPRVWAGLSDVVPGSAKTRITLTLRVPVDLRLSTLLDIVSALASKSALQGARKFLGGHELGTDFFIDQVDFGAELVLEDSAVVDKDTNTDSPTKPWESSTKPRSVSVWASSEKVHNVQISVPFWGSNDLVRGYTIPVPEPPPPPETFDISLTVSRPVLVEIIPLRATQQIRDVYGGQD